jgi:hypothetical protein
MAEEKQPKRLFRMDSAGQSVQVPLWATAGELVNEPGMHYVDHTNHGSTADLVQKKVRESQESRIDKTGKSLYDSIAEEGVKKPVTINLSGGLTGYPQRPVAPGTPVLYGGHHRLFSAADIHPDTFVPLQYSEQIEQEHKIDCPTCKGEGVHMGSTVINFSKPGAPPMPEYGDKFHSNNWRGYPQWSDPEYRSPKLPVHQMDVMDVERHPDKPGLHVVHGSATCDTCGGSGMGSYRTD